MTTPFHSHDRAQQLSLKASNYPLKYARRKGIISFTSKTWDPVVCVTAVAGLLELRKTTFEGI